VGDKNPKSGYMAEVATWPNTTKRGTSGGATDTVMQSWMVLQVGGSPPVYPPSRPCNRQPPKPILDLGSYYLAMQASDW